MSTIRRCHVRLREGLWRVACSDKECTWMAWAVDLPWAHRNARTHLRVHHITDQAIADPIFWKEA